MKKNILISFVVIIILVISGILIFKNSGNSGEENNQIQETNISEKTQNKEEEKSVENEKVAEQNIKADEQIVVYTDSGFSPASLTISANSKVLFKNESSKKMWVASDPHPGHSAYPQFDSRKGIGSGEIYEFVFVNSGTWKYHNHLFADDKALIIVQ